jgi:hypothetical protein
MTGMQFNNLVEGTEVDISYGFDVDSKGAVKPSFKASIHKLVGYGASGLPGNSVENELRNSLAILTNLAQEALDKTPKMG